MKILPRISKNCPIKKKTLKTSDLGNFELFLPNIRQPRILFKKLAHQFLALIFP